MDNYKIRCTSKRGTYHPDYCEDDNSFIVIDDFVIMGVFDGCSSGYKSHFASSLYAKILKKVVLLNADTIKSSPNTKDSLKLIIRNFVNDLQSVFSLLNLNDFEVLSTAIISLVNTKYKTASVAISGDGCICYDGIVKEFDQNNQPDYLAYHLNVNMFTILETIEFIDVEFESDFSISTDGIFSFIDKDNNDKSELAIQRLLKERKLEKSDVMLNRLINVLEKKEEIRHYDDVSIVRILINESLTDESIR